MLLALGVSSLLLVGRADTYCLRTSRRYGSVYGGLRRLIIDIADFRW
jgi:hypothetical protein